MHGLNKIHTQYIPVHNISRIYHGCIQIYHSTLYVYIYLEGVG